MSMDHNYTDNGIFIVSTVVYTHSDDPSWQPELLSSSKLPTDILHYARFWTSNSSI
jgi:hypothetical protein